MRRPGGQRTRIPGLATMYAVIAMAAVAAGLAHADKPPRPRAFAIAEGRNQNYFLQTPTVAAHLILRSGDMPRIIVATPAGNSGAGLWFRQGKASTLRVSGKLREVRPPTEERADPRPRNVRS